MNKGFTLIELMVSILILSMIATASVVTLGSGQTLLGNELTRDRLRQDAKKALDSMEKELRLSQSGQVNIASSNDIRFRIPIIQANGIVKLDANNEIVWGAGEEAAFGTTIDDWEIRYYLAGNTILREVWDDGTPQNLQRTEILATNIHSVDFTINPSLPTMVEITILTQKIGARNHVIEAGLHTNVIFRN